MDTLMDVNGWLLDLALRGNSWLLLTLLGLAFIALALTIGEGIVLIRTRSDLDAILRITVTNIFSSDKPHMDELRKQLQELKGMEAAMLKRGLDRSGVGPAAVEEVFTGLMGLEEIRLMRALSYLGAVGFFAPLTGLFGTVLSMIAAFHEYAENPSGGPFVIMSGLTNALMPLALALLISMLIFLGYNSLRRRLQVRLAKLRAICHLLLGGLKGGGRER